MNVSSEQGEGKEQIIRIRTESLLVMPKERRIYPLDGRDFEILLEGSAIPEQAWFFTCFGAFVSAVIGFVSLLAAARFEDVSGKILWRPIIATFVLSSLPLSQAFLAFTFGHNGGNGAKRRLIANLLMKYENN